MVEAPKDRIIWRAEIDPGTLRVRATPINRGHLDAIDPSHSALSTNSPFSRTRMRLQKRFIYNCLVVIHVHSAPTGPIA